MALENKIQTIKDDNPNDIIEKVRQNLTQMRVDIKKFDGREKEALSNLVKSSIYRKYLRGLDGVETVNCLINEKTIKKHQKEGGVVGKKGRILKSLDFYTFYFEENLKELKEYITKIKQNKNPKNKTIKKSTTVLEEHTGNDYRGIDSEQINPKPTVTPDARKSSNYKKWGFIITGVLASFFTLFYFSNRQSKEPINSEQFLENNLCKLPSNNKKQHICIFTLGEDNARDNAISHILYKKIKGIIIRDELPLEIHICKAFDKQELKHSLHSKEDSILKLKPVRKFLDFYTYPNRKIILDYRKDKHKHTNAKDTLFRVFKKRIALTGPTQEVAYKWNEQELTYFAYEEIVTALRNSKTDKQTANKLTGYIDNVLLPDVSTKHDIKILIARAIINKEFYPKRFNEDLNAILEIDSKQGYAVREKAKFLLEVNNPKALEYSKKTVEIYPKSYSDICMLAKSIAVFEKDYDKALELIELKITNPNTQNKSLVLNTKADLYLLKGNYDKAISYFNKSIISKDDNNLSLDFSEEFKIVHAFYLKGDLEKAKNKLEELYAFGLDRKQLDVLMSLVKLKENDVFGAIKASNTAKGLYGYKNAAIRSYLRLKLGNAVTALDDINVAIKAKPDYKDVPYLYNLRRLCFIRIGKKDYAKIDSLKIIDELDREFFKQNRHKAPLPFYRFDKVFNEIVIKPSNTDMIFE